MTLATLTDKERKDLLERIVAALGISPEEATPEYIMERVENARACQLRSSWSGIKLGPN